MRARHPILRSAPHRQSTPFLRSTSFLRSTPFPRSTPFLLSTHSLLASTMLTAVVIDAPRGVEVTLVRDPFASAAAALLWAQRRLNTWLAEDLGRPVDEAIEDRQAAPAIVSVTLHAAVGDAVAVFEDAMFAWGLLSRRGDDKICVIDGPGAADRQMHVFEISPETHVEMMALVGQRPPGAVVRFVDAGSFRSADFNKL
jgi:hypothetical protein